MGHIPGLTRWIRIKEYQPRSSALICTRNAARPKTWYRQFKFGKRKDGDRLLHFERETIAPMDVRLPRHSIEYSDPNVNLTSVLIRIDVSVELK